MLHIVMYFYMLFNRVIVHRSTWNIYLFITQYIYRQLFTFFSIGHGMGALWKNMARRNWSPCMHSAWHWVMFFFACPVYVILQNNMEMMAKSTFLFRPSAFYPTRSQRQKNYNIMSESAAAVVYCIAHLCVLLVDIRADCFRIYLETFLYKRRRLLTKDQTKHIKHQNSLCEMICCFVFLRPAILSYPHFICVHYWGRRVMENARV